MFQISDSPIQRRKQLLKVSQHSALLLMGPSYHLSGEEQVNSSLPKDRISHWKNQLWHKILISSSVRSNAQRAKEIEISIKIFKDETNKYIKACENGYCRNHNHIFE